MKNKRLLITLFILFIIAGTAAGLYYANTVLLPNIVKDKITSSLSASTGAKVTLQSVHIDLLRGIVLNELTVYDKTNADQQVLRIQRGSVSLLIIPLLKEKKIIIPVIGIDKAELLLVRQKDQSWNISPFFQKPATAPDEKTPIPLVQNISVQNMAVTLQDNACLTPQTFTLAMKNIGIAASLEAITAQGQGTLHYKEKDVPLEIHGTYTFSGGKIDARIKAKNMGLNLAADYLGPLPYGLIADALPDVEADLTRQADALELEIIADVTGLKAGKDAISIKDAAAHLALDLKAVQNDLKNFTAQGTLNISNASLAYQDKAAAQALLEKTTIKFTYDKNILTLNSDGTLKNASCAANGLAASGINAEITTSLYIPLAEDPKKRQPFSYEVSGKITSGAIDNIPRVDKITNITASFVYNKKGIAINRATFGIFNTVVSGSGRYDQKTIVADFQGEFDLADLGRFIPKNSGLPDYTISGAADIRAHFVTPIPPVNGLPDISGEAEIKDTWLKIANNPATYTTSKARLKFDLAKESLEWHTDAVTVNNENHYACDGTLKGFKTPEINASLIASDFKFNTQFTKTDDKLDIASFKGQFKDLSADLSGTFNLDGEAVDIKGRISGDLRDIPLKNIALKGLCQLHIQLRGPLKNFRRWNLKASGSSDQIQGYGYKANTIDISYEQADGIGIIDNLSFKAYDGEGLIKGRIDVTKDVITYALRGVIDKLDLAALKLDTPVKNQALSGTLGLKIAVQGLGTDTKNLKGGGRFTIVNGNLWEFNPVKELGTFLFAPRFGKMTFTSAQADFFINDNTFSSDNMELLGPDLNLLIEGKIGFNGTLDLLVNSQVPMPGPVKNLQGTEIGDKITKAGSLTAIEVKGTIQKPKYKLLPISANIVKKISDAVSSILP